MQPLNKLITWSLGQQYNPRSLTLNKWGTKQEKESRREKHRNGAKSIHSAGSITERCGLLLQKHMCPHSTKMSLRRLVIPRFLINLILILPLFVH
jgi:hypothetical protein